MDLLLVLNIYFIYLNASQELALLGSYFFLVCLSMTFFLDEAGFSFEEKRLVRENPLLGETASYSWKKE